MSELNLIFNNKEYNIDKTKLSSSINQLKTYILNSLAGNGAKIIFDGEIYNVDINKIDNIKGGLIRYFQTIPGNDATIIINGVEYGIDSNNLEVAIEKTEIRLNGMVKDVAYTTEPNAYGITIVIKDDRYITESNNYGTTIIIND